MTIDVIKLQSNIISPIKPLADERKEPAIVETKAETKGIGKTTDIIDISVSLEEAPPTNTSPIPLAPQPPAPPASVSERVQQLMEDFFNGTGVFEAGKSPSGFLERIQFLIANIQQITQGQPLLTYNAQPPVTPLYPAPIPPTPLPVAETTATPVLVEPVGTPAASVRPAFFGDVTPLNPKKGAEPKTPPVVGLLPQPADLAPAKPLFAQPLTVSKVNIELELLQKGELFA